MKSSTCRRGSAWRVRSADIRRVGDGARPAFPAEQIDGTGQVALRRPAAGDVADVRGKPAVLVTDEDDRVGSLAGGRHRLVGHDLRAVARGEGDVRRRDTWVVFSHAIRAARSGGCRLRRRRRGAILGGDRFHAELGEDGRRRGDAAGDVQDAAHHVTAGHDAVDVVVDELMDEVGLELGQLPGHPLLLALKQRRTTGRVSLHRTGPVNEPYVCRSRVGCTFRATRQEIEQ